MDRFSYTQPKCAPARLNKGRVTAWYMLCQTCRPELTIKQPSHKAAQAACLAHMRTAHQWMPNAIRNL